MFLSSSVFLSSSLARRSLLRAPPRYDVVSTPSPTRQVALAALLGLGGSGVDDGDGGGGGLAHVSVEPAGGTVRLAVAEGKAGGEGGGGEATGRRGSALEIEWVHEVVLAGEGSGDRGDAGEDSVRTRIRGALVPETATTLVLMPQVITALRLENAPPRMLSPTLRLPSQSADVEGDVETSIGSWLLAPVEWEVLYLDQDLLLYAPSTFEDHIVVLAKQATGGG